MMEKYQFEIKYDKAAARGSAKPSTTQKLLSINKQLAASQAGFESQLSKHDNFNLYCHGKALSPPGVALGPPSKRQTPYLPADEVTGPTNQLLFNATTGPHS